MKNFWKKLVTAKESAPAVMFQAVVQFKPLAPIDSQSGQLSSLYSSGDFSTFFERLFFFALSLGAIVAVLRLMYAGYLYMGQDMWKTKQKAKDTFSGVIYGLLLLLAVVLILNTINPQIRNLDILSAIKNQPSTGLKASPAAMPTRAPCVGSTQYCDTLTGGNLIPTSP